MALFAAIPTDLPNKYELSQNLSIEDELNIPF